MEVALHVIRRATRSVVASGGDELLSTANATKPLLRHETLHRATRHDDALTLEETPNLSGTTDATTKLAIEEDSLDLNDQFRIPQRPPRRRALLERVITRWSDLDPTLGKHAADRLDCEPVTMIVDELNYHGSRVARQTIWQG